MNNYAVFLFLSLALSSTCFNIASPKIKPSHTNAEENRKSANYTIIEQASHNTSSFTQGFAINDDFFYESSGLYNRSYVTKYPISTSTGAIQVGLPRRYFAEGLAIFGNEVFVLTWREKQLLVFDKRTLKHKRSLSYTGQGWGLAHNNEGFIMSNGSDTLFVRDSLSFKIKRKMRVFNEKKTFKYLNELEFAEQHIWANVWQSNLILKIHPKSGKVVNSYDLSDISKKNMSKPGHSVLNGIAYDAIQKAYWITGKLWPNRYLVRFDTTPKQSAPSTEGI